MSVRRGIMQRGSDLVDRCAIEWRIARTERIQRERKAITISELHHLDEEIALPSVVG